MEIRTRVRSRRYVEHGGSVVSRGMQPMLETCIDFTRHDLGWHEVNLDLPASAPVIRALRSGRRVRRSCRYLDRRSPMLCSAKEYELPLDPQTCSSVASRGEVARGLASR